MKRALETILIFALMLPLLSCSGSNNAFYSSSKFGLFDTVCSLKGYAPSRGEFESAAEKVFSLLEECDSLFDIYNDREGVDNIKKVNDLAGKEAVKVDPRIISLLELGVSFYRESSGALNIMLGAVLKLWHECREKDDGSLPDGGALARAAEHTGINSLVIDRESSTVYISDPEASLDVGAIAKGYAASLALGLLKETGISGALLDLGGNIAAYGSKPDGGLWKVGIEKGQSGELLGTFEIEGGFSVVTSGDYQRYFEVDGVRYHHIIDPATLYPASFCSQVSVICPDPAAADALSTALFVMDEESGDALAERFETRVIRG